MQGKRILVTGASGAVGHTVTRGLRERGHFVRGYDLKPATLPGEHRVADLSDLEALRSAASDVDTIIHLAAVPDRDNFADQLVPHNIVGTQRVLEVARLEGVERVIYGSSIRVVGGIDWQQERIGMDVGLVPGDHYGVSKATGEVLGRMYADRFGISVICARLGWFVRNPDEASRVESVVSGTRIYLSHDDALEFFVRAVGMADVPFAVVFVVSKNGGNALFDTEPARQIFGFEPRDSWPEGSSWSNERYFPSPRYGASLLPK
jgi:nucleoside-diphosphate-sugar epimerase